jgi:hypothetical protein
MSDGLPVKEIRPMDRRRFVPSSENLETRALQAVALNAFNPFGVQLTANLNIPISYQQKALRIERLPYYLEKIRPGRYIPTPEIQQIKDALFTMMDAINRPPPAALNHYNYELRPVVAKQSLPASDIHRLDYAFGKVLQSAHTPYASIQLMSAALFQMVSQVDTASPQPAYLGTNDYTLVLQTALAVGRPMPSPPLPKMGRNQGIQADAQHLKTPLHHPTLVGTYHFHTYIQIVSPNGNVVYGTTNVHRNNNYRLTVTTPLSVGVHAFRLRAVDDVGHLSRLSRLFLIKVVPFRRHKK